MIRIKQVIEFIICRWDRGGEGGEEGARWRGEGGEGEEEGPKPLDRVLWGPVITGAHAPSACIARDQLGFQGSQKDKD